MIDTFCPRTKAVADGALMFTLDHSVSSRMAKYTYGIESCILYDSKCTEHRARVDTAFKALSGEFFLPKFFSGMLKKVTLRFIKYFVADSSQ